MFENHQPKIAAYAKESSANHARVLKFVVLTVRESLFNIPEHMELVESPTTPDSELRGILFGSKLDSFAQIETEQESLFAQFIGIINHEPVEDQAASLINLYSGIFGIGLAKAGFVAQLVVGVGGCLDSHNLRRFGVNPNLVKSSAFKSLKTAGAKSRRIREYCAIVTKHGTCESFWDSWCEYVFDRGKGPYRDADEVSEYHCMALGLA